MVNRHQHLWRGMLIEHAHPFKNPFAGSKHSHSDLEILALDLLYTNNIEDIVSYQPFFLLFSIEVGRLSVQEFDKGFVNPMFIQGLRAPPTYELVMQAI